MTLKPPLITILGPTACGKSALGIALAQEFNGEIVSADSRQVYRGLDIGTGKVTLDEQALAAHHLLDIVEPGKPFSVADFQPLAFRAIDEIISRGRRPFLVGGTALYIYAVIDNYRFDNVCPNPKRRRELEKESVEELQETFSVILERKDAKRPEAIESIIDSILSLRSRTHRSPKATSSLQNDNIINPDDFRNKRRLIRAIEKLEAGQTLAPKKGPPRYDNLILGIDIPRPELYERIDRRIDERVKQGMIKEVKNLLDEWPPATRSLGERWLLNLGLEYRFITEFLQGKWPAREAMIARLKTASHAFARRQMTWWRKDKRIVWIKNSDDVIKKEDRVWKQDSAVGCGFLVECYLKPISR